MSATPFDFEGQVALVTGGAQGIGAAIVEQIVRGGHDRGGGSESIFDLGGRSRLTLELIADKWAVLILYALSRGTMRHNRLHREIGGISQKMLTKTLRRLERDGLVVREAYLDIPPRVEYPLTPPGRT